MTKIDTVNLTYELEQILITSSESTIERVVDVLRHQLMLQRIDMEKDYLSLREDFGKNHAANKKVHRTLSVVAYLSACAVGALGYYVLKLKGWF